MCVSDKIPPVEDDGDGSEDDGTESDKQIEEPEDHSEDSAPEDADAVLFQGFVEAVASGAKDVVLQTTTEASTSATETPTISTSATSTAVSGMETNEWI